MNAFNNQLTVLRNSTKLVILILVSVFLPQKIYSQSTEATLPNGTKIYINKNGTWTHKQITKSETQKRTSCLYIEKNLKIELEPSPLEHCVSATLSNTGKTKILRPDTHGFSYNKITDNGFFYSIITEFKDNFGNKYRVNNISPMMGKGDGVHPGESKILKIHYAGKLLQNAEYIIIEIPKNLFANSERFEATIPLKKSIASKIRIISEADPTKKLEDALKKFNSPKTSTFSSPYLGTGTNQNANSTLGNSESAKSTEDPEFILEFASVKKKGASHPITAPICKLSEVYLDDLKRRIKRAWFPPKGSEKSFCRKLCFE